MLYIFIVEDLTPNSYPCFLCCWTWAPILFTCPKLPTPSPSNPILSKALFFKLKSCEMDNGPNKTDPNVSQQLLVARCRALPKAPLNIQMSVCSMFTTLENLYTVHELRLEPSIYCSVTEERSAE